MTVEEPVRNGARPSMRAKIRKIANHVPGGAGAQATTDSMDAARASARSPSIRPERSVSVPVDAPARGSRNGVTHPSYPPPGSVQVREFAVDSAPSPSADGFVRRPYLSTTSMPGMSMSSSGQAPAHFMRPQAPYSDPAGASSFGLGRPARSWAAVVAACALFVGVVGAAVMRAGEPVLDATAAFIDSSRPVEKAAAATLAPPPPEASAPLAAVPPPAQATTVAPAGLLGASPTPAAAAVAVAVPVVVTPSATVAFPPVSVVPAAPAPKAAPLRPAVAWKPAPAAAPAPPPKVAAKPAPAAAAADEEPVAKKTASAKKSSKGGGSETDEETRKAIEQLRKAQLESSSSFGD